MDMHFESFCDHFGADTGCSSQHFGFRSQITVSAPNRFRSRSGCIFPLDMRIGRFQKIPHNQHPAELHSKSRIAYWVVRKLKQARCKNNATINYDGSPMSHATINVEHSWSGEDTPAQEIQHSIKRPHSAQ